MIIYMATNIKNGKKYIGKTKFSLEKRKRQHENNANSKKHNYFWRAIKTYGMKSFKWIILESEIYDESLLNDLEFHYIKQYHTFDKNKGYNLTLGGDGMSSLKGYTLEEFFGKNKAEETKRKISIKNKDIKKPKNFGKKISVLQSGENNSMYGKGYKISGKNNGMYGKKSSFKGKTHTEEIRNVISEKAKKWWANLSEKELIEYKDKMSKSKKGKSTGKQKVVKCPYCNKEGGIGNMKRYHFENCKCKN